MDRSLFSIPWFISQHPYLTLSTLVWLTYSYFPKLGFVSDDYQGIVEYDGKLQVIDEKSTKPRFLNTDYGRISRWVRYHLCGGNFPSKFKDQAGNPVPQGKIPFRHHALSIGVLNLAVLALYGFLSQIIGPKLAIMSLGILVVHPITTQAVAWCSGLGYPLSLLWMGLSLVLVQWAGVAELSTIQLYLVYGLFLLLNYLAINALFVAVMLWPILLLMGEPIFATINIVVSAWQGLGIVKSTINLRADEFKKQNMGHSTFIKPRKIIVALKTIWYYIRMIVAPTKLGLYHEWGYHYGPDVEREDRMMLAGLFTVVASIAIFLLTSVFAIKLAILWFYAFLFIFLNWITIQQFVTERYAFIPTLGFGIIVSYILQDFTASYMLILGVYLCRTWTHLPTYDNELRFYESNIWNFPRSEVAYGNLGVTYLRMGKVGSSGDAWQHSININQDYDVPYYNIYSHYRSNANAAVQQGQYDKAFDLFKVALPLLERCVTCKVSHFKELWTKELWELRTLIANPIMVYETELARLKTLDTTLRNQRASCRAKKDVENVDISINNNANQINNLILFVKSRNMSLQTVVLKEITQDSFLKKLLT